ncbi:MAG: tetratricopeptide repeat protein [Candidatus Korobacteraceae bacterium]
MASVDLKPEVGIPSSNKFFFADSRSRTFLLGSLLVVMTVALYAPVHNHPFFNLDDYVDVVENTGIHDGLSLKTIWWSFTTLNMANWIPLSWLSHALDYQMFGVNPAGHHDVNVLFHALDVVLLFWVLKRATGYTGRSFMVAALFAVHPMNVEAVAWIAERRSVLSMVFFLLALGAYRWYARSPNDRRYTVIALLYALGLLAKPQVITLPFVLLLWDYWPLQRMFPEAASSSASPAPSIFPRQTFSQLIKEKIPLLFLCIADAMLTVRAQASVRPGLMPPLSSRLKNAVFSYVMYIKKAFWPSGMSPELPHRGATLAAWQVIGCIAILLAITALVLAARRYRYLPVGWFWFLGMMVPMIGILQAGRQGMADRFGYQPYLGLFIMVCWGIADWAERRHISVGWLAAASAVVLLALSTVTYRQIGYWKDNLTLWEHGVATMPNHWAAEINVGIQLMAQGRDAEALEHFYRGSAINPDEGFSNMIIGYHEQSLGHLPEAISRYQHALRDYNVSDKDRAHILKNMGVAYRDLGDLPDAKQCFAQAEAIHPE